MNSVHSIEDVKKYNSDYVGKIKLKTEIFEDYLRIKIFDNGKGIENKNKEEVFSAGYTTKKKGQGTGLGLAICKKIIEKHKGEINFESGNLETEKNCFKVFFGF